MMADVNVVQLIDASESGSAQAREGLFATLYDELHRLAQRELRRNPAATLSATTLLHETFLNVAQRESAAFTDRARFMAYAARAMRGLVIDYLRNRNAQKRGGQFEITSVATDLDNAADDRELLRISDALNELSKVEPSLAEIVDLKFFCGFTFAEIAAMKEISERTVQRQWEKARIYLHRTIRSDLKI